MNELATRLTRTLNLRHPIVSAPMAFAAGGMVTEAAARLRSHGGATLV